MRFYSLISSLILSVFLLFISGAESFRWVTLPPGKNVIIPCKYKDANIQHKKYWCYHSGGEFRYCKIQAYANKTAGRVTVTDYPDQNLFTVTMRNLKTEDSGWYWCAVEIRQRTDVTVEAFQITVTSDPVVSVMESSVGGQEGGVVRIQCLYSAGYQSEQKQWCRSKDQWCYKVGRTDTSHNSAVQISDDKKNSSFSVEMSGLKKSDAGWYWCRIKDLQASVYLSISDAASEVTTISGAERTSISETTQGMISRYDHKQFSKAVTEDKTSAEDIGGNGIKIWIIVPVGLGLLIFLVCMVACIWRKKQNGNRVDSAAVQRSSTADGFVTYSTVKALSSATMDRERDVNNSFSPGSPTNKTLSPAGEDDGVIYSSVVHQ
ncbi:polymeric immunoglobulin receptor-like [Astyanax mexicanus]|nr:polymeric immunoglobulin receptor-like [Astyanax mexicanus]